MSEELDVIEEAPEVDPVTENDDATSVDETAQAESADSVDDQEGQDDSAASEEGEAGAPKKKGGFQRRIDELTREKYEALQAAEDARQQAEELRQYAIQQQMEQTGQEPFPTLEDAGYDETQYQRSVQAWYQSQAERQQQAQSYAQQMAAAQAQEMQEANALRAKVSQAVTKYPDYLVKIQDPNLPNLAKVSPAAFEAVTQSDQFVDVTYYLANNPSEVFRFQDLSPVAAVKEIAKLEMKFSGRSSSNPTPPPPPPSKVTGAGKSTKSPKDMGTAEFIAWRNSSR